MNRPIESTNRRPHGLGVLTALALTTLGGFAISGCVPIPYVSSEPVPDFSAKLPTDLLERTDETLVLTQTSTKRDGLAEELSTPVAERGPKQAVDALFLSANKLRTLNQRLAQKSDAGVALIFPLPPVPGLVPFTSSSRSLTRICVLARDGRMISVDFADRPGGTETLTVNRRNAIVSELQSADAFPFEKVDGPCGVTGETRWNKDTRSRVTAYIASLPATMPAVGESALSRFLAPGWTDLAARVPGREGLMLLAGTSWRGSKTAEPPIFLTGTDFGAVSAAVKAAKEADVIRLLPSYASGARALENISLERFCAVSGDGHVLRWNNDSDTWDAFDASAAWAPEELAMMREDRPGPACMPRGSRAWPASEQQHAIAFLESVGARPLQDAASEETKLRGLLVGPESASTATFLLVAIQRFGSADMPVIPLFLAKNDDADLLRALKSVPPAEFAGHVASERAGDQALTIGFHPDMLFLISAAGKAVQFDSISAPDWEAQRIWWDSSDATEREKEMEHWRDEAIKAVRSDEPYYPAGDFFWLGTYKGWSRDVREAVVRFLGRLPG
ncbi:MAG: hypothetical protein WCA09_02660 [Burkholderiales bacterium]